MICLFFAGCVALAPPVFAAERENFTVAEDASDPKGGGVQMTRPDGTVIYINPRAVAYVRAPLPGEKGNAVIVFTNGALQQVEETVEQVIHGIHIDMPKGPQP